MIKKLINEDGTSISDYPKNPLREKWNKQFPKNRICALFDELNYVNYSCINCKKCPDGDLFEVPKEDLEEYKKYLEEVKKYNEIHNPTIAKILSKKNDNN